MARRPRTSPRKAPRQERALATVDALLSATARVLVTHGYEATTTNRVAAVAGVSVGSLYQYFPGKEALVLEVMKRHCEALTQAMEEKLSALLGAPVEEVAVVMIEEMLAHHRVNPRLYRVIAEQVPRIGKLALLDELRRRFARQVAGYLSLHREEVTVDDVDLTAYVLVTAVDLLLDTVRRERAELLAGDELRKELIQLVLNHLQPRKAKRARPAA